MRFYDTEIRNEIHEQDPAKVPATAVPMDDPRVSDFFKPLPENHQLTFTEDGFPIISEIPPLTAEEQVVLDAVAYIDKRRAEYPAIGDQLDALFHAGVFPAEMAAQIQAIKDKYPKG
jgi:hypothetical protein